MSDSESFQESLSAGGLGEVEPFLPYLLQDLWALGGCPETAIRMLDRAGVAPRANDVVVDLGCGKGAMLIALAKRYGCRGYGVDLMGEFIDEARMLALEHGVQERVQFEVADMREAVRIEAEHGWIVYGHDAPIFGDLADTLRALRRALRPGGHVILDATCRKPDAPHADTADMPLLSEIDELFCASGFREVCREVIPRAEVAEQNQNNTTAIERRAAELKEKYPKQAALFDAYVQNQREESAVLEDACDSTYFLLYAV